MNEALNSRSNFVPKRPFSAWDKTSVKTPICPAFVPQFLAWDKTTITLCFQGEKCLVPRGTNEWDKLRPYVLSRPTLFPWKGKGGTDEGGTNSREVKI